jgi:hypothetical protein
VILGGVEHEAFFPEDTEVIDFFAPVPEDFLTGEVPSYLAQRGVGAATWSVAISPRLHNRGQHLHSIP